MNSREARAFEDRMKHDQELCDDFEMISDEFGKMGLYRNVSAQYYSSKDSNVQRLEKKQKVGRNLTGNGFLALAAMFLLVAVCAVLIALAS